jgi:signal transduction histidine kinase/DNA-binding response OmpR family regulator
MSQVAASPPDVPARIRNKWQGIVDLIAMIVRVPAALVMKVEPPVISVFVSSASDGNPYHRDEQAPLDTGLYCETVMATRDCLIVPDALADPAWRTNPDVALDMISYLGLPVVWPDGAVFGTICVLDRKHNAYSALYRELLQQFRDVLQADLAMIVELEHRRRTEEQLRVAKDAADAANLAKDEFMANVSHEIRTPMNAIMGMTDLVLDTPLAEQQRLNLKAVKSAADSLLGMIDDLLDFSKIEAGKLRLEVDEFSLRSSLDETLRILAGRAHLKGLELVSHIHADVPDGLIGDAGRLRQVLLNLVGNAIKFTKEGEIVVEVKVAEADDDARDDVCRLAFSVEDTGIGIAPERLGRIFRPFEQADTSTTRRYGGTGLGLTIAAQIVALMDGQISVVSEPGKGSLFRFTARFGRQPHDTSPAIIPPPRLLRDLPVLVVDDNATNRHIIAEWLRSWQMEPLGVGGGMAALDALWHSVASGRPYPIMLLDAWMPEQDGFAVVSMLRERPQLAGTRIIMLTSSARSNDPAKVNDLGIDAYLVKPVRREELLDTIYRVMSTTTAVAPAPSALAPPAAPVGELEPPLRILVAEDNEMNALVIEQLLQRAGHAVTLATSGREALDHIAQTRFDVALVDLHMPEIDGLELVQILRQREAAPGADPRLPVIALTARTRTQDRDRCLAAGMDDFLTKPIQPRELWVAIRRALSAAGAR